MALPENYFERNFPAWALAVSLVIHGAVIFFPRPEPPPARPAAQRLEATLAQRPRAQAEPQPTPPPVPETKPRPATKPVTPPRPRMLLAESGKGPKVSATRKWSPAEKQEMDRFLEELAAQPRAAPRPTLAQRSLAMAREDARQQARREDTGTALLERRPDSPPPDPFSLDHYVNGVIKRLNRSAAYVRNDPRVKGVRPAAVQFRLNPDGSLKSFTVLNAGDQQRGDRLRQVGRRARHSLRPLSPRHRPGRPLARCHHLYPPWQRWRGRIRLHATGRRPRLLTILANPETP